MIKGRLCQHVTLTRRLVVFFCTFKTFLFSNYFVPVYFMTLMFDFIVFIKIQAFY